MGKSLLWVACFFLFGLSVHEAYGQEKVQPRFTIMGLGDSITEGGDGFTCYLYPLWEKLMTAGYEFDFIGPRESKCRIGTLNHAGFSGHTVEFLDSKIDSLYGIYPADFVLLHAGHNHFIEENPVKGMIASYKSIIRKVHAINPDAKILVAQVIHSGKLPKYAYIPELNRQIAAMVDELHSKNVMLVDQATGFDWQTMTVQDKVHPNAEGGKRMAEVWFDALTHLLLPSGKTYAPKLVTYKSLEHGDSLRLHIFSPVHAKGKRPTIVFFFAGGWQFGTPIQFYRECAYYASKGMVAITVDYRVAYRCHATPFDSFEDAKDAMRWIREHAKEYHIHPKKIVAAGASAGGHLAAALGTIGSETKDSEAYRPDLMVLYYPVVNIGPGGYVHEAIKERYKEISPLYHVSKYTPPALFLVGTEDSIAPVSSAELFRQRMDEKGVPCELHLFEGAGHPIFYYRKPLTDNFYKVRAYTDNFLFLHHYLK